MNVLIASGIVTLDFVTFSGACKKSISCPFQVAANGSLCVYTLPSLASILKPLGLDKTDVMIILSCNISNEGDHRKRGSESSSDWEVISGGETFSNFYFPSSFEKVKLLDPNIQITEVLKQQPGVFTMYITTSAVAPFVTLESHALLGRFSKNAFVALPGKPERITFRAFDASDLDLVEFQKGLKVRSIWDTALVSDR